MYDSGECAEHFQQHINKYPPQVSSRKAAAGWACFVHNEVNEMLDKPEFDCNNLGSFYDCGCADGEKSETGFESKDAHSATARTDVPAGSAEHDHLVVEISKEA